MILISLTLTIDLFNSFILEICFTPFSTVFYDKEGKIRTGTGFDRNSIILGSFEFEPFQSKEAGTNVYNIADIPISVDFFSRWFVDNVVSQEYKKDVSCHELHSKSLELFDQTISC